jgi:DNA polymerase V
MILDNVAPVFLRRACESVSAGFPSAAEGYEDEPLNLHHWIVRNPAATFFYRVRGDALCGEHICDGSVIVVDRSLTPSPGRLILIEEAGAFTIVRCRSGVEASVCGVITAVVTRM